MNRSDRTEGHAFERRDECPACAFPTSALLFSAPFDRGAVGDFCRNYYRIEPSRLGSAPYELRRCERCSLVFQRYVGDRKLLEELYSEWLDEAEDPALEIASYRSEIADPKASRDGHELMAVAAHLDRPLSALKTLDYGMGWGLWAGIAAALGANSWGFDLSKAKCLYAERQGVRLASEAELGLGYDFINVDQVFEHVPDPLILLRRLVASLAPEGLIKVAVPSAERAPQIVELLESGRFKGDHATIMPVHPLEHINGFTRPALAMMASAAGLEAVRPSASAQYAFLGYRGSLRLTRPRKLAKEMVRPLWQWRSRSNLYVWLRKTG